jgi:hypothetical protein
MEMDVGKEVRMSVMSVENGKIKKFILEKNILHPS